MFYLIYTIIGLVAGSVLLSLISEAFASGMSRMLEAAFDFVEYRLALRDERLESSRGRTERGSLEVSYRAPAGLGMRSNV